MTDSEAESYSRTYFECQNCAHSWVEFLNDEAPPSCVVCGEGPIDAETLFPRDDDGDE